MSLLRPASAQRRSHIAYHLRGYQGQSLFVGVSHQAAYGLFFSGIRVDRDSLNLAPIIQLWSLLWFIEQKVLGYLDMFARAAKSLVEQQSVLINELIISGLPRRARLLKLLSVLACLGRELTNIHNKILSENDKTVYLFAHYTSLFFRSSCACQESISFNACRNCSSLISRAAWSVSGRGNRCFSRRFC